MKVSGVKPMMLLVVALVVLDGQAVAGHGQEGGLDRPDDVRLGVVRGDEDVVVVHHAGGEAGLEIDGAEAEVGQLRGGSGEDKS